MDHHPGELVSEPLDDHSVSGVGFTLDTALTGGHKGVTQYGLCLGPFLQEIDVDVILMSIG